MPASSRKNPYKTRQSFSKAINRVRAELPASQRKRVVVVEGLASEYGYQVKKFRNNSENTNKDKIKQFYYKSDNVYTVPGKGGEMTVWNEEGKQKLWNYYLTMYLKEGYALCLETCKNGNEKCSFHLSATYDQKICLSYVIHQRNSANVRSTRIYFSS